MEKNGTANKWHNDTFGAQWHNSIFAAPKGNKLLFTCIKATHARIYRIVSFPFFLSMFQFRNLREQAGCGWLYLVYIATYHRNNAIYIVRFVSLIANKQRVLMHGHQGWNVRHGLCHIYMIYVYIWVVYSFCLFCCLFIIVTTQFTALYKPCKPKPKFR